MTRAPRPLESFAPKLLSMLIEASIKPIELFADPSGASPRVLPKGAPATPCRTKSRHSVVEFTSPAAAARFRGFIYLVHELHELRRSLKFFSHPSAHDVYRVRISLSDERGSVRIRSHDITLDEILSGAGASPRGPSPFDSIDIVMPFDDPLNPPTAPSFEEGDEDVH
jgi:hypothetical protein